jgi:hypothetical protein
MLQILLVKRNSYNAKSILAISVGSLCDGWIFDSVCTFCICYNKNWFNTYKVFNGIILLRDNK